MDRVIKFRGKRTDNGKWIYGYYIKDGANRALIAVPGGGSPTVTLYPVGPSTVGQFIGLTDWDEKEIYEGDIISADEGSGLKKYRVCCGLDWDYPAFDVKPSIDCDSNGLSYLMDIGADVHIIGNITDNPELLGTEESH